MKFLIENYAGYESTQPLYFHKHINDYEEHESIIRQKNISIYDSFDTFKPDVYISSAYSLSKDSLLYLKTNKDKNIKLIICIDGLSDEEFQSLENILKESNVECQFFFTTSDAQSTRRTRVVQIKNSADINLEPALKIDYNIQKVIFVSQASKIRNYIGTFHVVGTNSNMKDMVDFCLPITMLSSVYSKYEEIIFTDISNNLPQCFFDAIHRGNKVYYDIIDSEKSKIADEVIGSIFKVGDSLNYNSPNKMTDFTNLKKHIIEKHSSLNRTKTLLSQLPQKVN